MAVRLSAINADHILHSGNTPSNHICHSLGRSHGHSAIGNIVLVKNYNDTIRNRNSNIPIFSKAP
jgi:hypothetical protein